MMADSEIIVLRCKKCGEIMDKALCEDHTNETEHDDFKPIYGAETF